MTQECIPIMTLSRLFGETLPIMSFKEFLHATWVTVKAHGSLVSNGRHTRILQILSFSECIYEHEILKIFLVIAEKLCILVTDATLNSQ